MDVSYTTEKDWVTRAGLRAVCLFANNSHRCGYVAVDKSHPLYGMEYSTDCKVLKQRLKEIQDGPVGKRGIVSLFCWDGKTASPDIVFDVHGGLTYSGGKGDYPAAGDDLWWFGFDCAHSGDRTKYHNGDYSEGEERTLEYVEQECESLTEQLAAITPEIHDGKVGGE